MTDHPSATAQRQISSSAIRSSYEASNLTLRQFRYWQGESVRPDIPLELNIYMFHLPDELTSHFEAAWQYFSSAADACRARLRVSDGIPFLEFGSQAQPVYHGHIAGDMDPGEAAFAWADPDWTVFQPGEPLFRHAVLKSTNGRTYWLCTASHLVCDGRSSMQMIDQMASAMRCLARGEPLRPLVLPSFEANMREERLREWRSVEDASTHWDRWVSERAVPFTTFGIDTRTSSVCRSRTRFVLSQQFVDQLVETCRHPELFLRSIDVTMANFFTALVAVWVWRHGGHRQQLLGIPFHGRAEGEHNLIGFKSEILPMRFDIDPESKFVELLQLVHAEAKASLKRRGASIRNPVHAPVYQAVNNYIYQRDASDSIKDALPRVEIPRRSARPEAVHALQYNSTDEPGAMLWVMYVHSETPRLTEMERLGAGCRVALQALVENPHIRLKDLSFIDPASERFFSEMSAPRSTGASCDWMTRWVGALESIGSTEAIRHGQTALTHRQLHALACRWAAVLRDCGIRREDRVVVWAPSGNDLAAAWLALMSLGATYVPIHHDTPPDQVRALAHGLGVGVVLCPTERLADIAGCDLRAIALDSSTVDGRAPLTLADPDPDALAHIFHTSGSTGVAKPIAVTHRALVASMQSWVDANAMQQGERIFHFYAITFDPWLTGLMPALWLGGTCVVSEQGRPPTAGELAGILARHGITTLCTPTAYFHALCDLRLPDHVERWIVGGEALAADKAQRFLGSQGDARATRLINAYGPTETTIWASILEVTAGHQDGVPVGRGLPTCGFRVCDEWGGCAPFGVPGELWISGPQVAVGYVGQPELTAVQFIERDGRRWYRTGDIVRWRKDGDLDFLGRKDRQVQIRGYRVEPGEIEVALRALDAVLDAVVVPVRLETTMALCAYVIARDGASTLVPLRLRSELLRTLPEYKVPKWFLQVDAFPKNDNGKIDAGKLPVPDLEQEKATPDRLPSLTLWDLRLVFEDILGLPRVGLDDDFFELGGDSLLLVELLAAIERRFGKTLEPVQIIERPTIGGLAPLLEQERTGRGHLVVEMKSGSRAPLFCIPGAGGIGVEFYPLSRRLPDDQPLIVLRSSGTDGHSQPPASIDALLEEHIAHIMAYRGSRADEHPVHLAGYSLGGIFAYEVAHRLTSRGIPLGQLFLIDAHTATAEGRALLRKPRASFSARVRALFTGDPTDAERQHLARQLEASIQDRRIMEASALGRYNLLVQAGFFKDIHSKPGVFKATYFVASNGPRKAHALLWKRLVDGLRIETIEGDHEGDHAIVREPGVAAMAEIVRERLAEGPGEVLAE